MNNIFLCVLSCLSGDDLLEDDGIFNISEILEYAYLKLNRHSGKVGSEQVYQARRSLQVALNKLCHLNICMLSKSGSRVFKNTNGMNSIV